MITWKPPRSAFLDQVISATPVYQLSGWAASLQRRYNGLVFSRSGIVTDFGMAMGMMEILDCWRPLKMRSEPDAPSDAKMARQASGRRNPIGGSGIGEKVKAGLAPMA